MYNFQNLCHFEWDCIRQIAERSQKAELGTFPPSLQENRGVVDIVDRQRRSAIMARIGPRDTAPELAVRSMAHRMGFRFRLHSKELPGRPDLVFSSRRLAIFVHGCFWHRHSGCRNATMPKTRPEFWRSKLAGNVERDRRNCEQLERIGWRTLVIWECETEDHAHLQRILFAALIQPDARHHKRAG